MNEKCEQTKCELEILFLSLIEERKMITELTREITLRVYTLRSVVVAPSDAKKPDEFAGKLGALKQEILFLQDSRRDLEKVLNELNISIGV